MVHKTYSWMPAGSRASIAAVRVPASALPLTWAEWKFRLADRLADLLAEDEEAEDVLRGALYPDEAEFVLAVRRPLDRAERLLMLESVSEVLQAQTAAQEFPLPALEHDPRAETAIKTVGLAEWLGLALPLRDPS